MPTQASAPATATTSAAVAAGRLALLVGVGVLAQSILWSDAAPWPMKTTVVALAVLSFVRTDAALLVLATLAPLGFVLTNQFWEAYPARGTEAFALAVLTGALARRWTDQRRSIEPMSPTGLAALAFCGVILASCLVQLSVFQAWQDFPDRYLAKLGLFLARDYHGPPLDVRPWAENVGFNFVIVALRWIEGLALALVVAGRLRQRPDLARRMAGALVLGGLGAVALIGLDIQDAIATEDVPLDLLLADGRGGLTGKVNTAASYYALVIPLALGMTLGFRRGWAGWATAAAFLAFGLRATGGRAGQAAVFVALVVAGAVWWYYRGPRVRIGRSAQKMTLVAVTLLAVIAAVLAIDIGRQIVWGSIGLTALRYRVLWLDAALSMWATYPIFGVGIGQYYLMSPSFGSLELLATYPRSLPHNQFAMLGAELGIVGFAALLGMMGVMARQTGRAIRRTHAEPLLLGVSTGLLAFLITCLAGQPLLVDAVGVPFWMTLGLVLGLGASSQPRHARTAPAPSWMPQLAVGVVVVLVLGSAIPRAEAGRRRVGFDDVSYGFYGWEADGRGRRYRWMADRARLFVAAGTPGTTIPLRSAAATGTPQRVQLRLDGQPVEELTFSDSRWRTVHLAWPPEANGDFRQIDLIGDPVWRPVDELANSTDERPLTVMVGEISAVEYLEGGLYQWEQDPRGRRFRWMGEGARLLVPPTASGLNIPIRSTAPAGITQHVRISLNGRLSEELTVVAGGWQVVRLTWPASSPDAEYHQIELSSGPIWRPADTVPGSTDTRQLTVMIGDATPLTSRPPAP